MGAIYRLSQFIHAYLDRPSPQDLHHAARFLPEPMMALFGQMGRHEQAHGLRVLRTLQDEGVKDPDLLAAALLHDVGKLRAPLSPIEKALLVLAKRLAPEKVVRWGQGDARGWRKPFAVHLRHADWGASMVAAAGGSKRLIDLIRLHHTPPPSTSGRDSARLTALQRADGQN